MEKEKMKLLFYLKRGTQDKNGKSPIMGRISVGRSMVQFSCKCACTPKLWDSRNFLRTKENEGCLPKEADKDLIENYRLFMLRDLGNKESSVSNRLRHLHQVIRKALQERYMREDPFELIDIETPTYERNALTSDDLHKLLSYRPHRSVDNHCRLIFLLGCFTGLAFSDLKKLRMDDVYTFGDGRRNISLCRTKTQNRGIVPLLPIAEEILTIVSDGRKEGLLFREFPTNSHFNRKIRDIIIKAGLPPHTEVTSHTARHTFATTICLENGLPIENQQTHPAILLRYGKIPFLNDWTQVLLQGERHHGITERKQ